MNIDNKSDFVGEQLFAQRAVLCEIVQKIYLNRGLAIAIQQNDTAAVKQWLSNGADPNGFINIRHRVPALFIAISDIYDDDESYINDDEQQVEGTSYFAPAPGNIAILDALLNAGADLHTEYLREDSVLMLAVRFASSEVVSFLISKGDGVNARYQDNKTALHYASTYRNVDIVKALLDGGADANAQDKAGKTPLMTAIDHIFVSASSRDSKIENIEELLDRGADVTIRDNKNRTVLDYLPQGFLQTLWNGSWVVKIRKKIAKLE